MIEAWILAHRFCEVLGVTSSLPSLHDMINISINSCKMSNGIDCSHIMSIIGEFLASELCDNAIEIILEGSEEVKRADFVPPTRNGQLIVQSPMCWQEILFRYLFTVAVAAEATNKPALHDVNYPLDHVHPYHIVEAMTRGPAGCEIRGRHLIPLLSEEAEARIVARRDSLAVLKATKRTYGTGGDHSNDVNTAHILRHLMEQMYNIKTESGGQFTDLCFLGQNAALEARMGNPLDFATIAARVEFCVYQMDENPLESFFADINFACKIIEAACQKRTSRFWNDKMLQKMEEVVDEVLAYAKSVLAELKELGTKEYAKNLNINDSAKQETTAVLPQNLSLSPNHCCVCWKFEQIDALVACSHCGCNAHLDCLEREAQLSLQETLDGSKMQCMVCAYNISKVTESRKSKATNDLVWKLVEMLHEIEFSLWRDEDKMDLLRQLGHLVSENPSIRGSLDEENEQKATIRKKMQEVRQERKLLKSLLETGQSHRQKCDLEGKLTKLAIEESKLDAKIKNIPSPRLHLLGLDRHWNRYWELPQSAGSSDEVGLLTEKYRNENDPRDSGWDMGIYHGIQDINNLIDWLNPKGERENVLSSNLKCWRDGIQTKFVDGTQADDQGTAKDSQTPQEMSEIEQLKTEILDFQSNIQTEVYHEIRGTDCALAKWRRNTEKVDTASACMSWLICLERMLNLSCFKVHWRLWAYPAPEVDHIHTLSSVWNRFENLRKAIKLNANFKYRLESLEDKNDGGPGKRKRQATYYAESDEPVEDEVALTDKELAMKLDAELNPKRRPANNTSSRRVWQLTSPRDRGKRANKNLRNLDAKFYGEDNASGLSSPEQARSLCGSVEEEMVSEEDSPSSAQVSSEQDYFEGEDEGESNGED